MLGNQFLAALVQLHNPVTQIADNLFDGLHDAVDLSDFPVEISNVGLDAPAFHCGNGRPHVNRGNLVNALCFVGAQVHTLRAIVSFQILILKVLPAHTPDHSVLAFIPVNGIFLMAFPVAGGETDAFSVFVKVVNLSRFRQPLSVIVQGSYCQQKMGVRIVSGRVRVVDGKIHNHSLGHKKLVAVKLWSYRRGKEDNRGRNELIEFLVRNNVLPKYGFPVDTVELYQNTNAATDKKLQMVRDLQLAISEYAPDSQVVADGKLYTSRYIRKLPQTTGQDWETAYIAQCNNPSCMTWNHRLMEPDEGGEPCVSCHVIISKSRWKQAIEPRKGFVADAKPKDVPMRKPDKAFRSDDFYIGDAQRQVMQKYAFVMKDGNRFQMETSINDSLMVVCNDDFYVCPHCGYAESTMENMEVAGFNSHQKTLEKKHITPWGKNCEVKLVKNKLCHVFKTDVVRLVFSTPQAGNQEVMLSVMYALLEALSSVMDIERNDIKGCLHKIVYDNKLIYAIVLYDAVAGGAGHVRRLVTEDGRCFRQVVEKAIAITKGCNCSPSCYSCLRNYYNQKIHDLLNRKYAYDFLENYYGELEPITNEEFENGELYNV